MVRDVMRVLRFASLASLALVTAACHAAVPTLGMAPVAAVGAVPVTGPGIAQKGPALDPPDWAQGLWVDRADPTTMYRFTRTDFVMYIGCRPLDYRALAGKVSERVATDSYALVQADLQQEDRFDLAPDRTLSYSLVATRSGTVRVDGPHALRRPLPSDPVPGS